MEQLTTRPPQPCDHASDTLGAPQVMRRYHIQDREDYKKYNKLSGMVTKLTNLLRQLDAQDGDRIQMTDELLSKCASELSARSLNTCASQCPADKHARLVE